MWSIISLGFGIRHWYDKFFFSSIWIYSILAVIILMFKSSLPYEEAIMLLQMVWVLALSIVAIIKVKKEE